MKPVLTEKEYVEKGGLLCPYCESSNIEGQGGFDFQYGLVSSEVQCLDCKHIYREWYTLDGYTEIE